MKRAIASLLAAVCAVCAVSSAYAAAPPHDIDKINVPLTWWEAKSSIYVYRKFKGIVTNVQTDPQYTFYYGRYVPGTMAESEKKLLYSFPKAEQEKFVQAMKWHADTKWRLELYGRTGERAWANKMAVAKGTEKPFQFIETAYGKDVYAWIVANRKALDAQFSTYIEGERDKLRAWTLSSDHSGPKLARIPTYEVYVGSMGLPKLEAMKRPGAARAKQRAIVDYFEYLLVTDGRLYFKASDSGASTVSPAPAARKKNVAKDVPTKSPAVPAPSSQGSSIQTTNPSDHVYRLTDADSLRDGYGNYLVPATLYVGWISYPKELESASPTPYPAGLYFDEGGIWNIPNGKVKKYKDSDIVKVPEKYFEGMDKRTVSAVLVAFLWDEGYLRSGNAPVGSAVPGRYPLKNLETLLEIRSKTDEIVAGADTPEDRLYAIYDWITTEVAYTRGDQKCSDGNCNALIAFKDKHSVCTWYATLYAIMAGYAGVHVDLAYDIWRAHTYVKYGELSIDPTNGHRWSMDNFLVPKITLLAAKGQAYSPVPVSKEQLDKLLANGFALFDYADYKGTPVDRLNVDRKLEGSDYLVRLLIRKYQGRKLFVSWDAVILLAADPVVLR